MRRLRGGGVAAFSASRTVRQCDTAVRIADDVEGAEHRLKGILDATIVWREVGFPITDWNSAREVLVTALSKDEWESVTEAEGGCHTRPARCSESDPSVVKGLSLGPLQEFPCLCNTTEKGSPPGRTSIPRSARET